MNRFPYLSFFVLLLFTFLLVRDGCDANKTLLDKIREDSDLSQFYTALEINNVATANLQMKQLTVFAPINEAFQKRKAEKKDEDYNLVLYHMVNLPKTTDVLEETTYLISEMDGNPPLWITHRKGMYHNDIYVNNARLLLSQSNYKSHNNGKEQVLHKIDEVLSPVMSLPTTPNKLYNPSAWEFLDKFESLNIHPHRLRSFRQRVKQEKKEEVFKSGGWHTFFIPVDEGFKNSNAALIDSKVIDGHIIPTKVLFTAATPRDTPYKSGAFGDNFKVILSFSEETNGKSTKVYVKSNTVLGDSRHTSGVVLAQIVEPNIPVKNGVVHLIHKPLVVVDTTVRQFIESENQQDNNKDKVDGPLGKFYWTIKDLGNAGNEFLELIGNTNREVTLFAPNNAAWEDEHVKNIILNTEKMRKILNMHLVTDQRLSVENIIEKNRKELYQVSTLAKPRHLYFNVITVGSNRTLTVEGGGVNATVVQENIAATNGIIHIIDRVLGVPHSNILDKLRTDPMLNDTYFLGQYQGFNAQLNSTTRKFTYFVPRDRAWADAKVRMPSAVKKIFMPQFAYNAVDLLRRHLVVSDVTYTMEHIKQLTNYNDSVSPGVIKYREVELPTQGGNIKLYVQEKKDNNNPGGDSTFVIHWKGEEIEVVRPNVECTNGVIHVIDKPFLKEGDIRVSGATSYKLTMLEPHLVMILVAKWLLL